MIIDTEKIKKLLASDISGYRISRISGLQESQISRYRKELALFENMTLKSASNLMKIIDDMEAKKKTEELFEEWKKEMQEDEFATTLDGQYAENMLNEKILENIDIKKAINFTDLSSSHYDDGFEELEFDLDVIYVFLRVKQEPHMNHEYYWDIPENVNQAIKDADIEDFRVIKKIQILKISGDKSDE